MHGVQVRNAERKGSLGTSMSREDDNIKVVHERNRIGFT